MNSLKLILSNKRYFAPSWVFTSINLLMGTWALYIPSVKENLSLSDSALGIALFSYAFGIFCILPIIPWLTKKIGTGKYTLIGILLFALFFIFPLLAPSHLWLCISLFFCGIFSGSTDVAMNALVSEIEKTDNQNFMSAAHGFFSLGGVIGAGIGSILIGLGIHPIMHIALVIGIIILSNLLLSKSYISISEHKESSEKSGYNFSQLKPLIGLAIIAFAIMGSEGAIEHWSNLYLLEIVEVNSKSIAGLGFILFSTFMTIGRFFGDKISESIGSLKVILYGCLLASLGFGLVLIAELIYTAIGFGIVGLGLSVVIPELFRVAGKTKNVTAAMGISFVSGIGFIGFLLGPVILGFVSNEFNLKVSFMGLLSVVLISSLITLIQLKLKKQA